MLDLSDWKPYSDPHVHRVNANLKVTLDAFRENYHFDYLHRTTLKDFAFGGVLTFDPFGRDLRNCSAIRSITELTERPEEEWGDVLAALHLSVCALPQHQLHGRQTASRTVADTADRCGDLRGDPHGVHGTGSHRIGARGGVGAVAWICETVVDAEDFWVAGRTEPGIRTGLLDNVCSG